MDSVTVKGQRREPHGKRAAGRLRKQGLVPGIVYGHGEAPVSVAVDGEQLAYSLHHGAHLVDLDLDGEVSKLLVKAVQYDYLGTTITHVDLTRVSLDERVEVTVPLQFRGTPVGVKVDGGTLLTPLTEVEIECPVLAIPDQIRVNVDKLEVGDQITLGELELPEGCTIVGHLEQVVAVVSEPVAEEAAPAAEEAGPAEPEVIRRKPEEGEEEKA